MCVIYIYICNKIRPSLLYIYNKIFSSSSLLYDFMMAHNIQKKNLSHHAHLPTNNTHGFITSSERGREKSSLFTIYIYIKIVSSSSLLFMTHKTTKHTKTKISHTITPYSPNKQHTRFHNYELRERERERER